MNKTGLFYSVGTKKTASIARKIQQEFGESQLDIIAIENATQKDFEAYRNIIIGSSTWFDGELPSYWDEVLPELSSLDLSKKMVAVFGLGDQKGYPDNFADGIGILANEFTARGATLVGQTSPEGYEFSQSQALKSGKFLGLVLDIENQSKLTDERIHKWVKQIKEEFEDRKTEPEDSFVC